jgi:hypothetical protein
MRYYFKVPLLSDLRSYLLNSYMKIIPNNGNANFEHMFLKIWNVILKL